MKITITGEYLSKTGTPTFVYFVEGTAAELKSYKDVQKENYREDETTKKPLYWSLEKHDRPMPLEFTQDNTKVFIKKVLVEKRIQDKADTWKALSMLTGKSVEDLIAGALGM